MGFLDNLFSKKQEITHIENEGTPFVEPEIKRGKISDVEVDYYVVVDNFGVEHVVLKNVHSNDKGMRFKILGLGPIEEI